ncbi:MAG: sulfatase [Thermoanaerobaculia bacterium]
MKRSAGAVALSATQGLSVQGCASPAPDLPRPDFLVIVIDCLRSDHVTANGYERPTTPSLDRIAAEGISFTRAFSQSNWTRPAMPSILTGLYPSEHGLLAFQEDEEGNVLSAVVDESVETLAGRLKAAGYATAMIGQQDQLSPHFGLDQGFDEYRFRAGWAKVLNRKFLRWLNGERSERFLALLHYFDLHWPYCPPKGVRGRYNKSLSEFDPCNDPRGLLRAIRHEGRPVTETELDALIGAYDEELWALDRRIGFLVDELVERGVWDDTFVIVTSDHGEAFLEHGRIGHQDQAWNELLHVPLIAKAPKGWPGPRGVLDDSIIETRSIAATFLEAARLESLGRSDSFLGALTGAGYEPPDYVVSETNFSLALQTRALKLITDRNRDSPQLFDLVADPQETVNVAAGRRRELAELRSHLAAWRESLMPATAGRSVVDERTVDELRAIGYLD